MKRNLLIILCLLIHIDLFSQALIKISLPQDNGSMSGLRAPNGTSSQTTLRAHFIIPKSEITPYLTNGKELKSIGFSLSTGVNTVAGGNIKIYLQNTVDNTNNKSTTWATAISGMTNVYDGVYTIPVGSSESEVNFNLSSTFTYTGDGLYVAYDYLGTSFSTTGAVYKTNNSLGSAVKMNSTNTTTPPTTLSLLSSFRPVMVFGYDNPFQNELSISTAMIDSVSMLSPLVFSNEGLYATIKNTGANNATNVALNLTVTGANPYTDTYTIASLLAGDSINVHLTGIPTIVSGSQTLTLSLPNDEVNTNNQKVIVQQIACDKLAYYQPSDVPDEGIGYQTLPNIVVVKYTTSTLPLQLLGAEAHIYTDIQSVGKQLSAVVLDAAGNLLAETDLVTINNSQLNTKVNFLFNNAVNLPSNTAYYVGIRLAASGSAYNPIGVKEPVKVPVGRVFTANGTGSLSSYSNNGMPMIGALITAEHALSSSSSNPVAIGTNVTFTATANFGNYNFKVNGSTVQNGTSNTYAYVPSDNDEVSVVMGTNGCTFTPTSLIMDVETTLPVKVNNFNVKKESQQAVLRWATQIETNNMEFILSRAAIAGDNFLELGRIQGAINSYSPLNYDFIDKAPYKGWNYYKLEQVDMDGQINLIGIKSLNFDLKAEDGIMVYPNPAIHYINIDFDEAHYSSLEVLDLNGEVIHKQALASDMSTCKIDISTYSMGTYILSLKGKDHELNKKFIKN